MASDPTLDTWHSRDLPVLAAVSRAYDEKAGVAVTSAEVAAALPDMPPDDIQRAGVALRDAGLINMRGASGLPFLLVNGVSAQARRLVGQWPTPETGLDRMIAALEAIANNTDEDDDTRGRARKALDAFAGAGKHVGLAVATAYATGHLPGA